MTKTARAEHDYRNCKDIVEGVLLMESSNWLKKMALAFTVRNQVSLDRAHSGENMPWSGLVKMSRIGDVFGILLAMAVAGWAVSVADLVVGDIVPNVVQMMFFIPLIVFCGFIVRLRFLDPLRGQTPGSYRFLAKHLKERVTCQEVKNSLALMERGELKGLTYIDYLKVAAHVIDAHEKEEKEKLERYYESRFIKGNPPENIEQNLVY